MAAGSKATVQQLLQQMPQWRSLVHPGSVAALSCLERCHTSAFGFHAYRCTDSDCGTMHYRYHSCRNRHCPHCGNHKKQQWIEARMKELLPVKYYHVVFTVPHQLNSLVMGNRKAMFNLLFDAAAYTLLKFGRDEKYLGALPGIISVLHTWGQQLSFHPHLHCIVSGGGMDKEKKWKEAVKVKHGVLFPTNAIKPVYRAYFLKQLQISIDKGLIRMNEEQQREWLTLKASLYNIEWMVESRQPMGGAGQVVEYLGRYTHKVAISNHRIRHIDADNQVTFEYKDYTDKGKKKLMTLSGEEFVRRFEQHLLPKGFCKIRHYGYLGNHKRKQRVGELLAQMNKPQHPAPLQVSMAVRIIEHYGTSMMCPCCKQAKLELLYVQYANGVIKEVLRE